MLSAVLLFLAGLLLLYKGGDAFVDSAVEFARRWGVSEIIIGATIVSMGTTIPEVTVSSLAAASGEPGIAYGNALGSVICNTALIAGLLLIFAPSLIRRRDLSSGTVFFFGAGAIFFCFALAFNRINRSTGALLLLVFLLYIAYNVRAARRSIAGTGAKTEAGAANGVPAWKSLIKLVLSAAAIFAGSNLLVNNGVVIAAAMHVPDRVIALTFIALGTSLPELVTALAAISKGHGAVSLGNIIGANFLNLTWVLGLSSVITPVFVPEGQLISDCVIAAVVMLLLTVPALLRGKTARAQGVLLVGIYALYLFAVFSGSLTTDAVNTLSPYIVR